MAERIERHLHVSKSSCNKPSKTLLIKSMRLQISCVVLL